MNILRLLCFLYNFLLKIEWNIKFCYSFHIFSKQKLYLVLVLFLMQFGNVSRNKSYFLLGFYANVVMNSSAIFFLVNEIIYFTHLAMLIKTSEWINEYHYSTTLGLWMMSVSLMNLFPSQRFAIIIHLFLFLFILIVVWIKNIFIKNEISKIRKIKIKQRYEIVAGKKFN